MKLHKLQQVIGYQFNKESLLLQAMTHRSKDRLHNERLEFLGDSILNFVVGSELYLRHPQASEGELTRMRANLVRGKNLSKIAKGLDIGNYLLLGSGESRTGGHQRNSILEDALEALIGAMYLDSSVEVVRQFVVENFDLELADSSMLDKDSKTKLQEIMQSRQLNLPEYEVHKIEGLDHEQIFYVNCKVPILTQIVSGKGSSRRQAEQDAAKNVLILLQKKLANNG